MGGARNWIEQLGLQPLEFEGGYYRETERALLELECTGILSDDAGRRSLYTAIYYLLTPDTYSRIHRLRTDEIYHFYDGDAVEMVQLFEDGSSRVFPFGLHEECGPQILVPAGTWQGARLVPGGAFALMGTTMAPGFDRRDFEAGEREPLLARYPEQEDWIVRLTPL